MCVRGRSGGNEVTLSSLRYLQPSMSALTKKWTAALEQEKKIKKHPPDLGPADLTK